MSNINGDPTETFDYVIVGAGAAGSILANRLSEDGRATSACWKPDRATGILSCIFRRASSRFCSIRPSPGSSPASRPTTPKAAVSPFRKAARLAVQPRSTAWPITVVSPETSTLGRPPETKGGGMTTCCPTSSALSAKSVREMTHIMGVRVNKLSRTWTGSIRSAKPSSPARSGKASPATQTITAVAQEGVGYYQRTILNGWRQSAARVFLRPAKRRANLEVRTRAQATAILFEGKRATGVRYLLGSKRNETRGRPSPARGHCLQRVNQYAEAVAHFGGRTRLAPSIAQRSGGP